MVERSPVRRDPVRRVIRILSVAMTTAVIALAGFVLLFRFVPPPSTLMVGRWLLAEPVERTWVPLSAISPRLVAAVVASEDARFCRHGGVDWDALREVIDEAGEDGPSRGASTITMQTVKNVFLWHGRSIIRKGIEIPLALVVDLVWSKERVIEVYLNVAEWGPGVFGAEAAARRHFRKSASELTAREAALLAAALPNPLRRDPGRPGPGLVRLAGTVMAKAAVVDPWLDCLPTVRRGR